MFVLLVGCFNVALRCGLFLSCVFYAFDLSWFTAYNSVACELVISLVFGIYFWLLVGSVSCCVSLALLLDLVWF